MKAYRISLTTMLERLPAAERRRLERAARILHETPQDTIFGMVAAGLLAAAKAEGDPPPRIERFGDEMEMEAASPATEETP